MSFNGSGTFNINSTGQPVVSGTVITSSAFNALTADLATGLSTTITKDGQTTVTNNIPFNSYKITNLGAGTAGTDAARVDQLQSGAASAINAAGTDTYTGTMTPALTAYTAGNLFTFVVPNTNTSSCTLNIDGLGAKSITRDGSTALVAGDLVAGSEVVVVYDGTRFQVLNSNSKTNLNVSGTLAVAGNTTLSGGTANGVLYLNGSKAITSGSGFTYNSAGNVAIAAPSSGNTFTASMVSGGTGVVVIGVGGAGATISTSQPSGTTNYWRLGQPGIINWDIQNIATTGEFRITNGTQIPFQSSGTGNVTINAPTSGIALTVNGKVLSLSGVATAFNLVDVGRISSDARVGAAGASNDFLTGTSQGDALFYTPNAANVWYGVAGATGSVNIVTNNVVRQTISNAGNVSINAPTSGVPLTISGLGATNTNIINFNGNTTGSQYIQWNSSGNTTNLGIDNSSGGYLVTGSSAYATVLANNLARDLILGTNNATRIIIGSTGNVTINVPASGVNLTLNGITNGNSHTASFVGSGTGYNYIDFTNTGGSANIGVDSSTGGGIIVGLPAYGFGITTTNTTTLGLGTNNNLRLSINGTGNVTINAPTTGAALAMTGTAAGTAAIKIGTSATTGAQTATWTAPTNKPGAAAGTVSKWIPIDLDGTTYYVPAWT